MDLAARHPATIERLVLVGPTMDPATRSTGRLALRWARNGRHSSPRLAPTIVHDLIDARPCRSMRTPRRAMEDPVEEKLSEIEAPTLVVRPERDRLVRRLTALLVPFLVDSDEEAEAEAETEDEAPEPAPR